MIGQGYFDTLTPPVLRRNILENPAWYTAYTPYQPEISQGRLEALLNFQTMVEDLTGLEVANASMLDEGTAAAEAMTLMHRAVKGSANRLVVDADVYRADRRRAGDPRRSRSASRSSPPTCATACPTASSSASIVQLPGASGRVVDWTDLVEQAHERGALVAVGADLLALTLITPPGEIGADVALRHHPALRCANGIRRSARRLPGRAHQARPSAARPSGRRLGRRRRLARLPARAADPRAAHPPRQGDQQHLHRAGAAGGDGRDVRQLPRRRRADRRSPTACTATRSRVATGLREAGVEVVHDAFFDTVLARVPGRAEEIRAAAKARGINVWLVDDDHVSVSCDEATTADARRGRARGVRRHRAAGTTGPGPTIATRTSAFLTHPAFTRYRTETEMMRYLRSLADKDIALDRSMIPLGSCTMKLNAAAEMEPITWPEFARQHPFAPASDTPGLRKLIADLESWLTAAHRLRRGVAAAQRGLAGGVRRPAGDPGLPPRAAATRSATSA